MTTVTEIEAVLPKLSSDELARVEATLRRLRQERVVDARFDGRPWPTTPETIEVELARADGLPPLMSAEEADRLDALLAAERNLQKTLAKKSGDVIGKLFP